MRRSISHNLILSFLILTLVGGGVFWFAREAQGVNRTWDCGGGDSSWNNDANWSGDTEPGASDVAIFDSTCTNNVTIDKSISVAGFTISSGYTGIITQSSTFTITVGSSNYSQADGTFTGGSGSISVSSFALSGGTFTSTSGTLGITGSNSSFTHTAGGTFNHNNGTVTTPGYATGFTINVATTETFYNFTAVMADQYSVTISSGDTLVVLGTFTHTDGVILTGTIEARGNVVLGAAADGGDATISFLVAGDQTITGNGGNTGILNVAKSSGTLSAGSTNLRVHSLTLSSGTFTSTTGTLTIGGFGGGQSGAFTHTAGGTFNHNSGTVATASYGNTSVTFNVATTETFNNFTASVTNLYSTTISSGDTIVVLGTLTHTNGVIDTGTVEARGNVSIASTADGGDGTISFLTTGDQTITGNGGSTCRLNIAKASGTVSAGSTNLTITGFTLSSGTFTSTSGTLTLTTNFSSTQSFTHTADGTWNHNNGTVVFTQSYLFGITIDVATTETFYNVTQSFINNYELTIASGDTLIVLGTFTQTDGVLNTGTIEARGNVVISSGADGGTALLSFTGGNDQTYTDNGGNEPNGDVTINKSGGTVILASAADWNATNQDLTITAGTLFAPDMSISTTTLTIGASGTLSMMGGQTLTLGGTLTNSGTIKLWGSGVCGGGDNALIRSSSTGVQRSWNGAGTFTIYDADVRDMAGAATITLYSSTNTANNGANWTFSGAACPAVPKALGLPSGKFNITSGKMNLR